MKDENMKLIQRIKRKKIIILLSRNRDIEQIII